MKIAKYHCLGNDFLITEDVDIDVIKICNRNTGIGADGVIIVNNNKFTFYNQDGTKAMMCGNGIRCAAKYYHDHYDVLETNFTCENNNFLITNKESEYTLRMNVPKIKKVREGYLVDNVVRHLVILGKPNLKKAQKLLNKYNANITFYNQLNCQTYEKGVGFTRGCGTGLISCMSVLYNIFHISSIQITSPGGRSTLKVEANYIYLKSKVFKVCQMEVLLF